MRIIIKANFFSYLLVATIPAALAAQPGSTAQKPAPTLATSQPQQLIQLAQRGGRGGSEAHGGRGGMRAGVPRARPGAGYRGYRGGYRSKYRYRTRPIPYRTYRSYRRYPASYGTIYRDYPRYRYGYGHRPYYRYGPYRPYPYVYRYYGPRQYWYSGYAPGYLLACRANYRGGVYEGWARPGGLCNIYYKGQQMRLKNYRVIDHYY